MACESKFIQNKTASLVKKVLVPGVIYISNTRNLPSVDDLMHGSVSQS